MPPRASPVGRDGSWRGARRCESSGTVCTVIPPGSASINRPFFRLFDEVNGLAQTRPNRFPGFGSASVHDWLPQFTELLRPSSPDDATAQAQATLALAVIRGLMLDDNATGDHSRIDAAFAVFDGL